MFEQDYIMRLIKEMVRAILRLLFRINTDSPIDEILDEEEERKQLEGLLDLIDEGKINQAENELSDLMDEQKSHLEIALLFYSYLNDKPDDFLTEHDFTREEVLQGLGSWTSAYGLEGISELFLQ